MRSPQCGGGTALSGVPPGPKTRGVFAVPFAASLAASALATGRGGLRGPSPGGRQRHRRRDTRKSGTGSALLTGSTCCASAGSSADMTERPLRKIILAPGRGCPEGVDRGPLGGREVQPLTASASQGVAAGQGLAGGPPAPAGWASWAPYRQAFSACGPRPSRPTSGPG